MRTKDELGAARLLLMIQYQGPWERLSSWLWRLHEADENGYLLRPVEDDSLRGRVATWCEKRDRKWREHYVNIKGLPTDRWKRV